MGAGEGGVEGDGLLREDIEASRMTGALRGMIDPRALVSPSSLLLRNEVRGLIRVLSKVEDATRAKLNCRSIQLKMRYDAFDLFV